MPEAQSPSALKDMAGTAVSLFSGAGGFCEGIRLAGWETLCAVELDHQACLTHAANFPGVALFRGDIGSFLRDSQPGVPSPDDLGANEIDLVFGGPPCQGFSQIGPRKRDDPRNLLFEEFARVVSFLRPRALVMENVPNMLAMENGHFGRRIVDAFRDAGYARTAIVRAVASDFGVPQRRRRVFLFGLRDGLPLRGNLDENVLALIDGERTGRPVTVREALCDLPEAVSADDQPLPYPAESSEGCSDYQQLVRLGSDHELLSAAQKRRNLGEELLHNHHTKGVQARRMKILASLEPGATGKSLPPELWNGVRGHKWRRLHPDKPAYTILAQMHRDLSEWIHPTHDRWITVREAARLQSFHDGFVFRGSECQQLKQVGNAVPPLMALAVGRAVQGLLRATKATEVT